MIHEIYNTIMLNRGLVFLAALLALLIRCPNWGSTFPEPGRVVFSFSDPFYHMRRVSLAFEHFPRLPTLDFYSNFPEGAVEVWPPLFDQILIAFAWLIGLGHPSPYQIEIAGALAPPLLGVLTVLSVAFFARRLFGARAGWIAAFLLAFMPAHVNHSLLGRPDHHVVEVLFYTLAAGSFMLAVRTSGKHGRIAFKPVIASGVFLASAILSSVVTIGLILPGVLFFIWTRLSRWRDQKFPGLLTRTLFLSTFTTLVLVTPIALMSLRSRVGSFDYEHLSLFQPLVLTSVLVLTGIFLVTDRLTALTRAQKTLGAFIVSSLLFPVLLSIPAIRETFLGSVGFLARANPILAQVHEAQPLLKVGGSWSLIHAWGNFAFLGVLLPLSIAMLYAKNRKGGRARLEIHFLIGWMLVTLALALAQIRFASWLAIPLVLIHSAALAKWWDRLEKRSWGWIGALTLILAITPLCGTLQQSLARSHVPTTDQQQTFAWLRTHTAEAGDFYLAGTKPKWGVMAPWDLGHPLMYISQRPVISDNFLWNAAKSVNFFITQDIQEAYRILQYNQARYILTTRMPPTENHFLSFVRIYGDTQAAYMSFSARPGGKVEIHFKERFYKTLYARLHLFDANRGQAEGTTVEALDRVRLVYESATAVIGMERIPTRGSKIFEFVPGARLSGPAAPGTKITVICPVRTNHLREFSWITETLAGPDGVFHVRLPYATRGTPYRTHPLGPYRIHIEADIHLVETTEEDVQFGSSIILQL